MNKSFNNSFNTSITPIANKNKNRKSLNSDEKRGVERFRRVKDESIEVDERLQDNSFDAKVSVHKRKKDRKREEQKLGDA